MRALALTALSLCTITAFARPAGAAPVAEEVSIVQLLAIPAKYHGKLVRIIGFLCIEFEGDAVYLHREDYDHVLTQNAIWVDLPDGHDAKLHQHYALLEGTFDARDHGHMAMFAGALHNITRMSDWTLRRQ